MRSPWTRAEGRARGKRAGPQTKARTKRRGNVAEKFATARTAAIVANGIGGVGAQPMAASFAERIDALHSETGQVLHLLSLRGRNKPLDSSVTIFVARMEINSVPLAAKRSPRIVHYKFVA